MRLIDADVLIEGKVENDPVVIAAKCAPTAYDQDRVVEQLEEACISLSDYPGYTVDIEKAIEIVKGGGMNEIRTRNPESDHKRRNRESTQPDPDRGCASGGDQED